MTTQSNLDLIWARDAGAGVTDPGDVKYVSGWAVEIPTYQHFNFVLQNNSKNVLVLAEQGHHTWQVDISYQPGAKVIGSSGKIFTCKTASLGSVTTGADPEADTTHDYWMHGDVFGNVLPSAALAKRGIHIKDVNTRVSSTSWDGNDLTLESKAPVLAFNVDGAADNWLLGNVSGAMVAVNTEAATLPDGGTIALGDARVYRLFHEGHPPTQSEVPGTIPDAPADSNYYMRINNSWTNASALAFPSGTKMLFNQTAAPTGWTKDTTHNNKALRVVSGTVGSGGTVAFTTVFGSGKVTGSTAITTAQMPGHTHTANHDHPSATTSYQAAHSHTERYNGLDGGQAGPYISGTIYQAAGTYNSGITTAAGGGHSHTLDIPNINVTTSSTGSGNGHTHTMDMDVQYVDLIIASKD